MTEPTENLILEHLKRFQAGQDRIERELKEIKGRLSQLDIGIASIRGDLAHLSGDQARQQISFDSLTERIERIERRLELA
jgi:septal ring factor EnvC (AmiA/AmiB activator)